MFKGKFKLLIFSLIEHKPFTKALRNKEFNFVSLFFILNGIFFKISFTKNKFKINYDITDTKFTNKEETYSFFQKQIEEEEKKYIGNILINSFSPNEIAITDEIDPNPKINREKYYKKIHKEKKLKPYIPDLNNDNLNEVNERYLQRTINLFKENIKLEEEKMNDMIKSSKFLNDKKNIKENKKIIEENNKLKKFTD